jgi:hypothetical protein
MRGSIWQAELRLQAIVDQEQREAAAANQLSALGVLKQTATDQAAFERVAVGVILHD